MIKTKRVMLRLLSLVFILPILLVFTACGANAQLDQKASCSVKGEFNEETVISQQDLETVVGDQEKVDGDGYRITMDLSGSAFGSSIDGSLNAIFKANEAGAQEGAIKFTAKDPETNKDMSMYFYQKDGYIYFESEGRKIKTNASLEIAGSVFEELEMFSKLSSFIDDETLFASIESNLDATIYKDGNVVKINFNSFAGLDMQGMNAKDVVAFLNFNDEGKLVAYNISLKFELNMADVIGNLPQNEEQEQGQNVSNNDNEDNEQETDIGNMNMSINMNITVSAFEGEIEYPNFDAYEAAEIQ